MRLAFPFYQNNLDGYAMVRQEGMKNAICSWIAHVVDRGISGGEGRIRAIKEFPSPKKKKLKPTKLTKKMTIS